MSARARFLFVVFYGTAIVSGARAVEATPPGAAAVPGEALPAIVGLPPLRGQAQACNTPWANCRGEVRPLVTS